MALLANHRTMPTLVPLKDLLEELSLMEYFQDLTDAKATVFAMSLLACDDASTVDTFQTTMAHIKVAKTGLPIPGHHIWLPCSAA